ncbi:hypothetical protein AKO1_011484 [Acrasis kona]|uniref:Defective in cullin neddylation protein n=1 Tax=Acrasis kona TaxID=1008807 RepID=A0AAW2Z2Y4_9EUKA
MSPSVLCIIGYLRSTSVIVSRDFVKEQKSSNKQKEAITNFRNITSTSEKVATEYLKKFNYALDAAVNDYFNNTGNSQPQKTSKEMEQAFEKYKQIGIAEGGDPKKDSVQGDGLMALLTDIGVDPEQIEPLILLWKLNCQEQYNISSTEWKEFADLGCDSPAKIKSKLPQWKRDLEDANEFKRFYMYVFDYARDKSARSIPVETAVPYFKLILNGRYKHINDWCEYLENVNKKAVTKDTWQQFLEFVKNVKPDLSDYDPDQAWPVVIDEFVEHLKKKGGK